jgi:cytochrome P450
MALDFTDPVFKADPYPTYARLRRDMPVAPTRLPDGRAVWLVTRYDDVALVLKDARFAKDRRRVNMSHRTPFSRFFGPLITALQFNMLDLDPPDHTRLRGLVHKAFTPRFVERLRDRIQALAVRLLDDARGERWDLVSGFALPIPATVIADLLGVPATDRHRFHRWSNRVVTIASGRDFLLAMPAVILFLRYLRRLVAARRMEPRDDLISALVQAEESGDRLSSDELLAMLFLLLVAGHETTVNLISNGTLALLQNPEELERLRHDPELLRGGAAIEELLRYTSPVQVATERYAVESVQLSGTAIPAGSMVLAVIGSANHDEHRFAAPEKLDLTRAPNPHLAFGHGVHYCLGAPLARLEGQIAVGALLERVPDLKLAVAPESLQWRKGIFVRGVERLPLRIRAAAALAA